MREAQHEKRNLKQNLWILKVSKTPKQKNGVAYSYMNTIESESIDLGCLCELFALPREKGVLQSAMVKTMPSVPSESAFTVGVHNSHGSHMFLLRIPCSSNFD